jgi:hypothetical protein
MARARTFLCAVVAVTAFAAGTRGGEAVTEESVRAHIQSRFTPNGPAVSIAYDVSFRLMGLNIVKMATATIETAEGTWRNNPSDKGIPVCVAEFGFESVENGEPGDEGRVFLKDRMLSVLTMPDLNTLWYVRRADERISIPLIARKKVNYLDAYNMEEEPLRYYHENYLDGSVATNLPDIDSFVEQGKEVSSTIKLISSLYYGKRELIDAREPYVIRANINGVIQPLAVTAEDSESPVPVGGIRPCALKISVRKMNGDTPGNECFAMWVTSFRDVADRTMDSSLLSVAKGTPDWSMVPLVTDYDLCLGSIRCSMTGIGLTEAGGASQSVAQYGFTPTTPTGMLPSPLATIGDGDFSPGR